MKATFVKDFAGIKKGSIVDLSDYSYSSLKSKGVIGDCEESDQIDNGPKKRGRKKA